MIGWPQNPLASQLDANPDWSSDRAKQITTAHVKQLTNDHIRTIKDKSVFWNALSKEIRDELDLCLIHRVDLPVTTALTLVKVTSAAERAMQVEAIRQTVPAEGLVQMLLQAAETGILPGASEELKPGDRVKVMLGLLNKVLPEAKSVEVDDRADRADRKRRSLKDTTRDQLKNMNEAELRDLINKEIEEE